MKKKNLKLSKLKILIEGLNQTLQLDIESTNSLRISRLLLKLSEENELFNKERIKLCEKYAKKDENGKSVTDETKNYIIEDRIESLVNKIQSLKNELGTRTDQKVKLKNYINYIEQVRNQKLIDYIPELSYLRE